MVNEKTGELEYDAKKAKAKARTARRSRRFQWQKIEKHTKLRDFIIEHLAPPNDWSPDAISGYLRDQQSELTVDDRLPSISTQNIYDWLRSSRGQQYCQYLMSGRYRVKHHTKKTDRVMIPDRVSINERPVEVTTREQVGDWEFDTVVSSKRSGSTAALAVAQERASRLVRVVKVPNLKPGDFAATIIRMLLGFIVKSLTTDNGIENRSHTLISAALKAAVYFTDPYSSWQKGGVENVNKMLRRYFPKGTNFSNVTQEQIDEAVRRINNKPRRCLGYKSALQYAQEKGLLLDGGVLTMGRI